MQCPIQNFNHAISLLDKFFEIFRYIDINDVEKLGHKKY